MALGTMYDIAMISIGRMQLMTKQKKKKAEVLPEQPLIGDAGLGPRQVYQMLFAVCAGPGSYQSEVS